MANAVSALLGALLGALSGPPVSPVTLFLLLICAISLTQLTSAAPAEYKAGGRQGHYRQQGQQGRPRQQTVSTNALVQERQHNHTRLAREAEIALFKRRCKIPFTLGTANSMNYVQFNNPKSTKVGIERKVFILLHGYGGGPGLFVDMYERFLDAGHYDAIYGVDLPGLGSSNRTGVDFAYVTWSEKLNPLRSNAERATSELEAARRMTDQYIAGIHMWATEVGLTSFSLGGHSLGGFIAGKYAAKHPDQVDALVLISPIGMGRLPSAEERKMGWFNSIPYRAINMVWSINLSPHIVYRKQTYSKPDVNRMAMQENNFVDWCVGDLERRVGKEAAQWDPESKKLLCEYIMHITLSPWTAAEYTGSVLFTPIPVNDPNGTGVLGLMKVGHTYRFYAKEPFEEDLLAAADRLQKRPVLVLFGDNDWVSYPGIDDSVRRLVEAGISAEKYTLPDSRHCAYMDNNKMFVEVFTNWTMRHMSERTTR